METSKTSNISINIDKCWEQILPVIKKTYRKYQYLGLSFEDYSKLIKKRLTPKINDLDNSLGLTEKYINSIVGNYIKETLTKEEGVSLINRYINTHIRYSDDYDKVLQQFRKLCNFFDKFAFVPDPDLCIVLIKSNEILNQILNDITRNNMSAIKNGDLEDIFVDFVSPVLIETYCVLNGIIEEDVLNDSLATIDIGQLDNEEGLNYYLANADYLDTLKLYLREINLPLLTKEEEVFLALQKDDGNMEARQILLERNLRLVVAIAKRFMNKGVPFSDLIQEGNIGLLHAIDKFDVSQGYRLATYATRWIKQSMGKAIYNTGTIIRIPAHLHTKIVKLTKTMSHNPEVEEIEKHLKKSHRDALNIHNIYNDPISINTKVGKEKKNEYSELLTSEDKGVEDIVINKNLLSVLEKMFDEAKLTPNEKLALTLRFGFNNLKPMAFEKIGKEYLSCSHEGARKTVNRAIKKLRRAGNIKELAIYTEYPIAASQNIEYYRKQYDEKTMEEGSKNRKAKTIYQLLGYPKEIVDALLETLSEKDRCLILIRNGEDLNNPSPTEEWNGKKIKQYYNSLIPKLKRKIALYVDKLENSEHSKDSDVVGTNETITTCVRMTLTGDTPLETKEVANILGLNPSEVRDIESDLLLKYRSEIKALSREECASKSPQNIQLVKKESN